MKFPKITKELLRNVASPVARALAEAALAALSVLPGGKVAKIVAVALVVALRGALSILDKRDAENV